MLAHAAGNHPFAGADLQQVFRLVQPQKNSAHRWRRMALGAGWGTPAGCCASAAAAASQHADGEKTFMQVFPFLGKRSAYLQARWSVLHPPPWGPSQPDRRIVTTSAVGNSALFVIQPNAPIRRRAGRWWQSRHRTEPAHHGPGWKMRPFPISAISIGSSKPVPCYGSA